jgi:DUF971 family protein
MKPVQIKVLNSKDLFIKWDDQSVNTINLSRLRSLCPCATCVDYRENQSSTYIPFYTADQVLIKNINIIGNYAVGITWQDGHNTGIYEFSYLEFLAKN